MPAHWRRGWSFPYKALVETAAAIGLDEMLFWQMSPAEFERRVNYAVKMRRERADIEAVREKNAMYRAAWVCATIMNFAGRQLKGDVRVRPEDLLIETQTREIALEKRRVLVERHRLDRRFGIPAKPYGIA